jgi:hypothetical protein
MGKLTAEVPATLVQFVKNRVAYIDKMIPELMEEKKVLLSELSKVAGVADNHVTQNPPIQQGAKSDFDKLPWQKNKWGEWLFSNLPEAKELVSRIGTAEKYVDGGWEYKLSGEGKKFLNRSRAK